MRTRAAARRIVCVLFYGKQRASGDIPHNKLKEATGCARVLARDAGRERWQAAGGRSCGWVTPLGCSSPPTSRSTERVDGRAIGVSVRKALFELGRVILAQQINPLTQKTPKEEAEHCLSNYRGSLQKWEAVQYRCPPDEFAMRSQRGVRQHALAHAAQPARGTRALVCGAARCRAAA